MTSFTIEIKKDVLCVRVCVIKKKNSNAPGLPWSDINLVLEIRGLIANPG